MANYRFDRIGEEVKREVSDIILNDLKDPGMGFVSIVLVEVSGDMRNAKVYYSVMGDEKSVESTKEALKRSAGYIRREIAHRLSLRYTPELNFIYDNSIEHGIHIAQILHEENLKQEKKDENK